MSIITLLVLYDIVQYHVYNRKHVYNNNIKGYQQSIEFSLSYHTFLSLPIHCGTVVLNELPNWIHPNKLKNQLQYVDSFLLNSSKTVSVLGMNVPPYRLPVGLVLLNRHVIHLALCFLLELQCVFTIGQHYLFTYDSRRIYCTYLCYQPVHLFKTIYSIWPCSHSYMRPIIFSSFTNNCCSHRMMLWNKCQWITCNERQMNLWRLYST